MRDTTQGPTHVTTQRATHDDSALLRDPLADFLAIHDEGAPAPRAPVAESVASDDEKRFLSFDLTSETYAANIMDVREILKPVAFTEVPRAPPEVLGVISKRGVVMPVVDLAAVLGLRPAARGIEREQRILVAGEGDRICGLRVDRVRQVVRIGPHHIEEVPASLGARNAHMLLGLGRPRKELHESVQILILLDVDAVLTHLSAMLGADTTHGGVRP